MSNSENNHCLSLIEYFMRVTAWMLSRRSPTDAEMIAAQFGCSRSAAYRYRRAFADSFPDHAASIIIDKDKSRAGKGTIRFQFEGAERSVAEIDKMLRQQGTVMADATLRYRLGVGATTLEKLKEPLRQQRVNRAWNERGML